MGRALCDGAQARSEGSEAVYTDTECSGLRAPESAPAQLRFAAPCSVPYHLLRAHAVVFTLLGGCCSARCVLAVGFWLLTLPGLDSLSASLRSRRMLLSLLLSICPA